MNFYILGHRTALEKLAIDLTTARSAFKRLFSNRFTRGIVGLEAKEGVPNFLLRRRPKQIPTKIVPSAHFDTPDYFSTPIGWASLAAGNNPKVVSSLNKMEPEFAEAFKSQLMKLPGKKTRTLMGGRMLDAPRSGNKMLKQIPDEILETKHLSPMEKELMNRIGGIHEGVERRFALREPLEKRLLSQWSPLSGVTHMHPEVLLQEHNMLSTLPPEMSNVKKFYQNLRKGIPGDETAMEMIREQYPGFVFGETPKIPRTARKTISRRILDTPLF